MKSPEENHLLLLQAGEPPVQLTSEELFDDTLIEITSDNSTYYALTEDSVFLSTDGKQWDKVTLPTSEKLHSFAGQPAAGGHVAILSECSTAKSRGNLELCIFFSNDGGKTWSSEIAYSGLSTTGGPFILNSSSVGPAGIAVSVPGDQDQNVNLYNFDGNITASIEIPNKQLPEIAVGNSGMLVQYNDYSNDAKQVVHEYVSVNNIK